MRRISESYREELSNSSPISRASRSSENLTTLVDANKDPTGAGVAGDDETDVSNREDSSNKSRHNRGMSDPFDSQRMMDQLSEQCNSLDVGSSNANPTDATSCCQPPSTLPRFPVAATKSMNCWSVPDISKFSVRGATYLSDKVKTTSGNYLLESIGADLLTFDDYYEESSNDLPFHLFLNGKLLRQPAIAIVFRFPWGCMNQYFALPEMYLPFLHRVEEPAPNTGMTPQQHNLACWLSASTEEKNAKLKLIALVSEGPFIVRQLVTGRPVLIGTKLPIAYHVVENTLVCELEIGNASSTAKRIVSICRRYMNALTVDLGWLIEATTEESLPEQMMGGVRLHHPDALQAPKLQRRSATLT